ncbi:sulfatase, partial [bacterium]|nr:sulfatase [bacterium]
ALRASGASIPDELPGHDLIASMEGESRDRLAVFGEIFSHDVVDVDVPSRSLLFRWMVSGRWKLIVPTDERAAIELFDIVADPDELHSLAESQPTRVASLRRQLDLWWTPK